MRTKVVYDLDSDSFRPYECNSSNKSECMICNYAIFILASIFFCAIGFYYLDKTGMEPNQEVVMGSRFYVQQTTIQTTVQNSNVTSSEIEEAPMNDHVDDYDYMVSQLKYKFE